jgi:predicted branched-subunit amino acid permease
VPPLQKILSLRPLRVLFGPPGPLAQTRIRAFGQGLQDFAPATIATGAWALVTGVATVKAGIGSMSAALMCVMVYAGSAQLAALPLIAAGAPIWLILITATIVNLRFVIFSAGLRPYFQHLPIARRMLLGYLTSDLGYLLATRQWGGRAVGPATTSQVWYYLGLAAGNWLAWCSLTCVGVLLADRVPADWGLDFVGVLALVAIVVPSVVDVPTLAGATAAALVAVVAQPLPLRLAVLAAVVAGVAAAVLSERLREP